MALRHPWFSQTLKRKCPDDLLSQAEGSHDLGGGGFGAVGTVYGGVATNACNTPQASQPNLTFHSNGRAAKRVRKFESRNLERGFAELSIQPTSPASSTSPVHIQQQYIEGVQVGDEGVWSNFAGNVGEGASVVCSDGSTLPLLRSSSVDETPSPEVIDVQMSTSTWYEPEKDRIVITSLDDSDEYDGDDEGQQLGGTGTKPTTRESDFTISPAFLNAINRKLAQAVDPPSPPPTDASASQALILFRPLPPLAPPPANDHPKDVPGPKEGMLDSLMQNQPSPTPSGPSPFHFQNLGQSSFVSGDDDMEIEML